MKRLNFNIPSDIQKIWEELRITRIIWDSVKDKCPKNHWKLSITKALGEC